MRPASASDKYYVIRLIKCSFKEPKKLIYYVANEECCYS